MEMQKGGKRARKSHMRELNVNKEPAASEAVYQQLIAPKPYLWWWVHDRQRLSLGSVIEGVLAFGDMDDVRKLFFLVGREKVKEVFFQQISGRRCNYRPQTVNFFKKVFARDV